MYLSLTDKVHVFCFTHLMLTLTLPSHLCLDLADGVFTSRLTSNILHVDLLSHVCAVSSIMLSTFSSYWQSGPVTKLLNLLQSSGPVSVCSFIKGLFRPVALSKPFPFPFQRTKPILKCGSNYKHLTHHYSFSRSCNLSTHPNIILILFTATSQTKTLKSATISRLYCVQMQTQQVHALCKVDLEICRMRHKMYL